VTSFFSEEAPCPGELFSQYFNIVPYFLLKYFAADRLTSAYACGDPYPRPLRHSRCHILLPLKSMFPLIYLLPFPSASPLVGCPKPGPVICFSFRKLEPPLIRLHGASLFLIKSSKPRPFCTVVHFFFLPFGYRFRFFPSLP